MKVLINQCVIVILIAIFPVQAAFSAEYSGILDWANRVYLSVPVSGVIADVKVKTGDRVKQGEVMLTLDQRPFEAKLLAARAMMSRYKPGRDESKRELERAKELFERTVLSQVELDQAKNDYAEKDALYTNARAKHQQAVLDKEYSELKAPDDVVVVNTRVIKGQTVVNDLQAVPLIEVARQDLFETVLIVNPDDMKGLGLGSQVEISAGEKNGQGKIVSFEVQPGGTRIKMKVQAAVNAIAGGRPGQLVKVKW